MALSEYNSWKIRSLSTILIIMVLYIHSFLPEAEGYTFAGGLQRFMGIHGLAGVANNLFFVISGFLFFQRVNEAKDCVPKIKKRVKSLLIPYFLWNCIFVLYYIVFLIRPNLSQFASSGVIDNFRHGIWHALYYLFIAPANFPLWFLRDLIVMTAISPILFLIIKKLKWWALVMLLIIHLIFPVRSLLFFTLGASISLFIGIEKIDKVCHNKSLFIFSLAVYIVSAAIKFPNNISFVVVDNGGGYFACRLINTAISFCSLIAIWSLFDVLFNKISWLRNINKINGYSFFVYVFHMPILAIIEKIALLLCGKSEPVTIVVFLISPAVTFFMAMVVSNLLQKYCPRTYSILVGGRK